MIARMGEDWTDAGKAVIERTLDIFENFEVVDTSVMRLDGSGFGEDLSEFTFSVNTFVETGGRGVLVRAMSKRKTNVMLFGFIMMSKPDGPKEAVVYHDAHGPFLGDQHVPRFDL